MSLDVTQDGNNIYSSSISGSYHSRSIFGGTILCQSILAAYQTVKTDMHLHSFQVYFLIRGDKNSKLMYVVESIMEGRSFVKRSVFVKQNDHVMAKIFLSFKINEPPSNFHFEPQFPDVKSPDKCQLITEIVEGKLLNSQNEALVTRLQGYAAWLADFPIDVKAVDSDVQTFSKENTTNKVYKWLKLRDRNLLNNDKSGSKYAYLAFISDYGILQPILTMHSYEPVGFMVSLDHVMWFHCDSFDHKQWLLLEAECDIATNGTSLNSGRIWSEEGTLLATMMQEGIVRPPKPKV